MKQQLLEYGLTEEEATLVLEKYPLEKIEAAIKRTPFKSKALFRVTLKTILKHY